MTTVLTEKRGRAERGHDDSSVGAAVPKNRRKTSALLEGSLLSTAILLGTNPVAVKYAVGYVPPLPFAALRFVAAGLVLLAILRFFDPQGSLRGEDFWGLAGPGGVGVGLNNVSLTLGGGMTQ